MKISELYTKNNLKKAWQTVTDILCILCLTCTIIFMVDMENALFQTIKNIHAAKALLMFTIFLFLVQRVRLLNWQSAVVTLTYWPIGYLYKMSRVTSPDLYNRDKVVVWIVWLALLIAVDMAVYQKVNPLQRFHKCALVIYALMTVFMIFFRHDRNYPIILVLAFLFYLIPLDQERWKKITNQFCDAWLVAFLVILYRSLRNNPEVDVINGRWYGDFLNIGYFGLFLASVLAVILYKLYQAKSEQGRKSVLYVLYLIFLVPILWAVFRVSTVTMFIGIGCILVMGFVVIRKDTSIKKVVFRLLSVVAGTLVLCVLGFGVLRLLAMTDEVYWENILLEGNTLLKPIANLICRAHYMFDGAKWTTNGGVFAAGSMLNYLDLFSSWRLSIIYRFAQYFNFTGNETAGIQVGEYFAFNAHNAYAQVIYEYGYIGGGLFILWLGYSTVAGAVQYLKEKKMVQVLVCLWMAAVLGVLMGEMVNMYDPIMVMTLVITYPIMIKMETKREAIRVEEK